MTLNELLRIGNAISDISDATHIHDEEAIIDALLGVAWDEEDAGRLRTYYK